MSWSPASVNYFGQAVAVTDGQVTFAIASRVVFRGETGTIARFDYGAAIVRLSHGTVVCQLDELVPVPTKAPAIDAQAIDENLRRMRHAEAAADLKALRETGARYEDLRAAEEREEGLGYAE